MRKGHILAIASVWIMAAAGIAISINQERGEVEKMRVLNVSIEISEEQFMALKRRAARISKTDKDWNVNDEVHYTAAAAVALQAEDEMRREREAVRNAQIDDIVDGDAVIRVVAAQKEPQTLSDDPKGEPGADAVGFITGTEDPTTTTNKADVTTANEQDLFLRCIQAEAGNQPIEGRQAAAEVVLNRVRDGRFPNTITEVILDPGQFGVVSNGSINTAVPDETTKAAVEAAIAGSRVIPEDYVFFNNKPIGREIIAIGGHYFGR